MKNHNLHKRWWLFSLVLIAGLMSCEEETFCLMEVCECDQIIEDCMPERKCVDFYVMESGTVAQLPDGQFAISPQQNQSRRFLPCNLPNDLQKDGLKITFSGGVKESESLEPASSRFFVLTWVAAESRQ